MTFRAGDARQADLRADRVFSTGDVGCVQRH